MDLSSVETNMSLRGKINGADLAAASRLVAKHTIVEGKASLTFDLTARGTTSSELLGTLAGRLSVASERESNPRFMIDLVALRESTAPQELASFAGTTLTDAMKLDVVFFSGRAFCRNLSVKLKDGTFSAQGTFELSDGLVDLIAKYQSSNKSEATEKASGPATAIVGSAEAANGATAPSEPEPRKWRLR
ncbi:MAG: AsmA-like C-terminal region-containing protein, partial [Pseudomonadota bacterium]